MQCGHLGSIYRVNLDWVPEDFLEEEMPELRLTGEPRVDDLKVQDGWKSAETFFLTETVCAKVLRLEET